MIPSSHQEYPSDFESPKKSPLSLCQLVASMNDFNATPVSLKQGNPLFLDDDCEEKITQEFTFEPETQACSALPTPRTSSGQSTPEASVTPFSLFPEPQKVHSELPTPASQLSLAL